MVATRKGRGLRGVRLLCLAGFALPVLLQFTCPQNGGNGGPPPPPPPPPPPVNTPPQVIAGEPTALVAVIQGQPVTISWTDSDPDNNATIRVFYDVDGIFGTPDDVIIATTGEDPDGLFDSVTWDTTGVAVGTYNVGVEADDRANDPVFDYASGQVIIQQDTRPAITMLEPSAQVSVKEGDLVQIAWSDNDPDDNAVVTIFYDTDQDVGNGFEGVLGIFQEDDPTDATTWTIPDATVVPQGLYYVGGTIADLTDSDTDYAAGAVLVELPPSTEILIDLRDLGTASLPGAQFDGFSFDGLAGASMDGGKDVSGDGVDDFIIAAPTADSYYLTRPNSGEAYLILGFEGRFESEESITLNKVGTLVSGIIFAGPDPKEYEWYANVADYRNPTLDRCRTGESDGIGTVRLIDDIDGDGLADLVIGCPYVNPWVEDLDYDPPDHGFDPGECDVEPIPGLPCTPENQLWDFDDDEGSLAADPGDGILCPVGDDNILLPTSTDTLQGLLCVREEEEDPQGIRREFVHGGNDLNTTTGNLNSPPYEYDDPCRDRGWPRGGGVVIVTSTSDFVNLDPALIDVDRIGQNLSADTCRLESQPVTSDLPGLRFLTSLGHGLRIKFSYDELYTQNGMLTGFGDNVAFMDMQRDGAPELLIGFPRYPDPNNPLGAPEIGGVQVVFLDPGFRARLFDTDTTTINSQPQMPIADCFIRPRTDRVGGVVADRGIFQFMNPVNVTGDPVVGPVGQLATPAGIGDFNDDGLEDFVCGAPAASPSGQAEAGQAYLIFGRLPFGKFAVGEIPDILPPPGGFPGAQRGIKISGTTANDRVGEIQLGADLNGDAKPEWVMSMPGRDSNRGMIAVIFGSSTLNGGGFTVAHLATSTLPSIVLTGEAQQDQAGLYVAEAGDVNGDGTDDLLIAAPGADAVVDAQLRTNCGKVYVVFGDSAIFNPDVPATISLSEIGKAALPGRVYVGRNDNDGIGTVSKAGDVDNDGISDFLIGRPDASPNGVTSAGEVYLLYGTISLRP